MKILLLGASGQLGVELKQTLNVIGEVIAPTRNELDLTDLISLKRHLLFIKPTLIVNACAYTAVDKAEDEPDLAIILNAKMPKVLADYAFKNNILLVHYSTDYVFNGLSSFAYHETDRADPISVYGLSKLKGEQYILESRCKHFILRTSWLFSSHGMNFMTKILSLAKERNELKIVSDQWGSPTSCALLCEVTLKILITYINGVFINDPSKYGIYHASGLGEITWFDYARLIYLESIKYENNFLIHYDNIKPTSSSDFIQQAKRPKFSVLNCTKLQDTFNIRLQNYKDLISNEIIMFYKSN